MAVHPGEKAVLETCLWLEENPEMPFHWTLIVCKKSNFTWHKGIELRSREKEWSGRNL